MISSVSKLGCTVLFLVLVAGAAASSPAQELRSFGADRACGCSVVLRHVARLGREADTVAVSTRSDLARTSRGVYYLAPHHQDGTVAVLSSDGKLVSSIGRAGGGPGELSGIRDIRTAAGDSLLVLDYSRLTLFDPTGAFVRAKSLPDGLQAFRMSVMADGKVVLNNYMPRRRSFTLLDAQYAEIRTFGRSIAGARFPDSDAMQFLLAPLDSGRFAAVQQHSAFLVQVWDTSGVMRKEFRRDPVWFTPSTFQERLARTPRSPPFTRVVGAYADLARRQLWIAALVADRNWRAVAPPVEPGKREIPGFLSLKVSDYPRAYDTIIEVLNWDSGEVLLTQRFNAYVTSFVEGGLLYGLAEDSSGLLVVDVWRPEIVPARQVSVRGETGSPDLTLRSVLARLPGLRIVTYQSATFAANTRGSAETNPLAIPWDRDSPRRCWVQVYLAAIRIYSPLVAQPAPNIDDYRVRDLEAVEFYPGSTVTPAELGGSSVRHAGAVDAK